MSEFEGFDPFGGKDVGVSSMAEDVHEMYVAPFEGDVLDVLRPRTTTAEARKAYGEGFPSFDLHHICGNRWCKNPAHLIAVTPEDHRKIHARETHCE